jgi:NAD(P)-dependent dehydrogenase (short-subunit alcohol dehydrogenase family)
MVTQAGVEVMRKQSTGGDILNIVSKNALVSGPNNAGYGSAKAAQLHLSRLNAAELGATRSGSMSLTPMPLFPTVRSGRAPGRKAGPRLMA